MGENRVSRRCGECGSIELIRDFDTGELVCGRCGYVLASRPLDHGPEWRSFNAEQRDRRPRTGAPLNLAVHDKGLSPSSTGGTGTPTAGGSSPPRGLGYTG